MSREKTCEELIDSYLAITAADIRAILDDPDALDERLRAYFNDTEPGFCGATALEDCYYQLTMMGGGPSDHLRFFHDGTIEYRYHDWFDGAGRVVTGEDWAQGLSFIYSGSLSRFRHEHKEYLEYEEDVA